jgi:hypothetical protein
VASERTFIPERFTRIFTVDRGSGRHHIRLRDDRDRLWVQEQCNLSKAGAFAEVGEIPANTPRGMLCQNCFPPIR